MGDRVLGNRSGRAAFLCYHSIAPEGPTYMSVTAEMFERHLAQLRRRGFRSAGLRALAGLVDGERPDRAAFLTFDDGFRDNFETALPLLREYGFAAFVFVLPPLVDSGGAFDWPEVAECGRRYPETMRSVTWTMLEEMREGGFEVGSHTLSHAHLAELDGESLRDELWESRRRIRERLGGCDTLAYPFGEVSERVVEAAADCGYRYAFSLPSQTGQRIGSPLSIPRVNVDYRDGERRFAAKLSAAGRRLILSPPLTRVRRRLAS